MEQQSIRLERLGHVPLEPNPALLEHAQKRAESVQNRIADAITAFSGSMCSSTDERQQGGAEI
jgi:hypothetical protein